MVCILFCVQFTYSQNQGLNNNWILGYSSYGGLPFGHSKINFYTGIPTVIYDSLEMDFRHSHSNISDSLGNLLFYTNGYYIADASHDTMLNGSNINPSSYTSYFNDGLGIPQANLILPLPGSSNIFYFIHSTANQFPGYTCSYNLFSSRIDMNQNNGLGEVILKNQVNLSDSMNPGKIVACKHANGKDWWIMCHRINSNKFFKFLLTSNGLIIEPSQNNHMWNSLWTIQYEKCIHNCRVIDTTYL